MSATVPVVTKATCVIAGAIADCLIQGASDPVVERTALGILGLLMLGGLPLIVKAVWNNTAAVLGQTAEQRASTEAQRAASEAFRALTVEIRESTRDYSTARVQAVGELKDQISSGVVQVKEKIDTSTDKILSTINHGNHGKKGGSAA